MSNSKEKFKSKIGGQAVIEGVMMRGIEKASLACRLSDGTIDLETWNIKNGKNAPWYTRVPFVRGTFNMITSLKDGVKCLNKSADKQYDEDEEPGKLEKWLQEKLGDKFTTVFTVFSTILGFVLAYALFAYLPMLIAKLLDDYISSSVVLTLVEGAIKIFLLILYMWLISLSKSIGTTYQYHGAEHKTIACYEAGEELTPENVKNFSRFHPRCGTSFILIVFIISIIVFSFVTWNSRLTRMLIKLVLLPLVIGISYEIIRLAGRYNNIFTRIISAPGLALQRLTTKEPNEKQMEVAIKALQAVIPEDKESDRW